MSMLSKGDKAPDIALLDQRSRPVYLADHIGAKVLVYFYPKADTPGCTTQACAARGALPELAEHGVSVIGISPDAPGKQRAFDAKYELGFPLLADEDHAVAMTYGVWGSMHEVTRMHRGIIRSAFLLDEQGMVKAAWYDISPTDMVPKALAAL